MGYTAPTWVNGKPPAINAARLNDLCSTVQTLDETMPTKQDKLTFDNVPTSGSSNPVKSSGIYTALQGKQSSLTFDNVPTSGSSNPVKSSGIYTALQGKQSSLTFDSTPTQGSTNPVTSGGVYGHRVVAGQKEGTTLGTAVTSEGFNTVASGNYSHAEGVRTEATADFSHSEGYETTAESVGCHSEGMNTVASGNAAHSEGVDCEATGDYSHSEGYGSIASGMNSHAEGNGCEASGECSSAGGSGTVAEGVCQRVFGQYNISNTTDVEIVGWGTSTTQKNIRTLDQSGNMTIAGTLTQSSDAKLKTVEGEIPDVSEIHAVRFRWNDVNGQHDDIDHVGYIAQDVEEVAPFMVKEDSNGYKALDYIAFLCAKMELLERRVKELEEKKE